MNFRPFKINTWKTGFEKFGWKGIVIAILYFPSILMMWIFYYAWR